MWLAFAIFAGIASTAAWSVVARKEPAWFMRMSKKKTKKKISIWPFVTWPIFGYTFDLGSHMKSDSNVICEFDLRHIKAKKKRFELL